VGLIGTGASAKLIENLVTIKVESASNQTCFTVEVLQSFKHR